MDNNELGTNLAEVGTEAITKQQAIDALNEVVKDHSITDFDAIASILDLPPAQPEIVQCKDCKHRDPEDKKCDCGHDIQWQLPRQDDWFCADGKRREANHE